LAKVAVALDRALAQRLVDGTPAGLVVRHLARGRGWTVDDVICTSGPHDRSYEEQHVGVRIALVVAGTFQCRSTTGSELLTPGALLLGNDGQCFECGHDHAQGDRCVSFGYTPAYFERIAADAGLRGARPEFQAVRIPPLRVLAPLAARACTGLVHSSAEPQVPATVPWEELSLQLAVHALRLTRGVTSLANSPSPLVLARVTEVVRTIDRHPNRALTLGGMADAVGVSSYHFVRAFRRVTGVTPHQFVLRARLRDAALRLIAEPAKVLDIALDCGFGDVSNFNHAFRAEFGISPRRYRTQHLSLVRA
jgi:AraC family transcriptional regulator